MNPWEMDWGPSPQSTDKAPWDMEWGPTTPSGGPNALTDVPVGVASGIAKGVSTSLEGADFAIRRAQELVGLPQEGQSPLATSASGWNRLAKSIGSYISPEATVAKSESAPGGQLLEPSTWELGSNPSLRGYAQLMSDVFGQLGPILLSGYAGGVGAAGVAGGLQSGGSAVEEAAGTINKMASEGTLATQSKYYRELVENGTSPEEALEMTRKKAVDLAFIFTAPIGTVGGALTSKIAGPLTGSLAAKGLGTRIAAKGTIGALEEGTEEVFEGMATRGGINVGAGTDIPLGQGTFGEFLTGALAGGPVGVAGSRAEGSGATPTQEDIDRIIAGMNSGVPQPPSGGAPPPQVAPASVIPFPTGPEEFGLGGMPTEPMRTVSPEDPVDATMGTIAGLTPIEVRQENGMWNVYIDGSIENAFGAKSDADRWVANYYKSHGVVVPGTPAPPAPTMFPDPVPSLPVQSPSASDPDSVMTPWGPQPLREDMESVRANPTPNKDITRLLGINQYGDPRDMFRVAVKEMYQNSFDAVKGALEDGSVGEGKIDISINDATHTVSVKDNGVGVSLEVLVGPFFSPGGTHKTTKRPSGGFGIAKLAFQNPSESFRVVTMSKDGVVAEVVTSGAAIKDFLENVDASGKPKNPDSAPLIRRRRATDADRVLFPEGHGTLVEAKLPKEYINPSTHELTEIPTRNNKVYHDSLLKSPLLDNISVTFNGQTLPAGKNFNKNDFTPIKTFKAGWGTIRVLRSNQQKPPGFNSYANATILSNGLYQFDHEIEAPYNFYFDIQPTGDTRTPGYPFTLNRQGFSPAVEKDIEQIAGYLKAQYQLEKMKEMFTAFGDMQYTKREADGSVTMSSKTKIELTAPLPDTAFKRIAAGGTVDVKDGKLIQDGQELPSMNVNDLEKNPDGFTAKDVTIDQNKINTEFPVLHNNVDIVISDSQVVPFTELLQEKFGPAFDNYVHTVGNVFLQLRDIVAEEMNRHFPQDTIHWGRAASGLTPPSYLELKKNASGISFDIKYRGVSMRIPFSAEFINLAVPEKMDSPDIAAFALFGTMVHELAHFQERSERVGHGPFAAEMQRITYVLSTSQKFLHSGLLTELLNAVEQNWKMQQYMHGVITSGTFNTRPRDKRIEDSEQSGAPSSNAANVAADGGGRGDGPAIPGRPSKSTGTPTEQSELGSFYQSIGSDAGPPSPELRDVFTNQRLDQRRLDRDARGDGDIPGIGHNSGAGPEAVFRQPAIEPIRRGVEALFQSTGGTPPSVAAAASHADRMNWWFQWTAGLLQLQKSNPQFFPLTRYVSTIVQMHNEEAQWQDAALRIAKRWRSLGEQGERLAAMIDDVANMRYRTADEIRRGIQRLPMGPELKALQVKHRIDTDGMKVFEQIHKMFDGFLEQVKGMAFDSASRIITDPVALAQKMNEIQAEIDSLRARPYFPMMRFGRYFIMKKDAAGRVVHFETFERRGARSAQQLQSIGLKKLEATATTGEKVSRGVLPESSSTMMGLPSTLLQTIKDQLNLSPDQITALEHIQLMNSPALSFKRMMKSDYVPGYSKDFKRAFARYFFHGSRYLARTRYGHALNGHIAAAQAVQQNKANVIAEYMRDHLKNTVLDVKGDFGTLKAATFVMVLGYVASAAFINMTQVPIATYSHLAGKFGGFGLGNKRATTAIIKAALNVKNFYRRGSIEKMSGFEYEALSYGIKTGRVSETQAAELAALSAGGNLLGMTGTRVERGWTEIMEKSALMFEMAEQFNRRVTWRATLELAMKFPNAKAVREAVTFYRQEYEALQTASGARRAFTPAEAAAIVTAANVVDQTQAVYAQYARPRMFRGRKGTLFMFKMFLQSQLYWLGQNKRDVLPQYLVQMMLLGGLAGAAPGYDDLRDLIRAFSRWFFRKEYNIDHELRKSILYLFDGKVPPDLALHGLSRVGFGIPAVLDLAGSIVGGKPGRGLQTKITGDINDPLLTPAQREQGRGQNIPYPVMDRHRALSLGNILPIELGKMLTPQGDRDLDRTIADQTHRASGAAFGIGWNIYKTLMAVGEGRGGDFKTYERMLPRALGDVSAAYRAYSEGRERGRGGINSAPTIVPYDIRDPEQMMEIIFKGLGYQTLRETGRWDNILAEAELIKFYDGKRKGLLEQFDEARYGQNEAEQARVREAIIEFNTTLPDWARGRAISPETIQASMEQRARQRQLRDLGLPLQKSNMGISDHVDRLFPEGTVDVRRVR